jgi:periplasmic divalent cation tolerance protein
MTETLTILCTCGSADEAKRVAHALVDEQLAACVNILPGVESVYRWEGSLESSQEILLIIKSTDAKFGALRDRIQTLHSYDTPEIIALRIEEGSEKYLSWLREQVS